MWSCHIGHNVYGELSYCTVMHNMYFGRRAVVLFLLLGICHRKKTLLVLVRIDF